MNEEYIYVKTNDVQKDMHDFVSQFGDEIAYISYPENIIKLKNSIIYRFTYTLIGIRKYYSYTEVCNHHLKLQNKNLQQENQQLKEQLEKYQIENFNLREDIIIKKMSFPIKEIRDKSLLELYSMPSYEDLKKENKKLKEKQKEFIEWLNNIINNLEKEQTKRFNHSYQYKLNSFNNILSKYKEIIGDK